MEQRVKYRLETFDEHYTAWFNSNCGNCKYLIRGIGEYTCDKHLDKIPAAFWNNKKSCPNKKEADKHKPFR